MNQNFEKLILPMCEEFRDYLHDETKTTGKAESISFPVCEGDVCSLLRHFSSLGVHVTVQGNRTGLTAASVPGDGHIMSLSRMDKVTGMRVEEDGSVYVSVQPGLSLGVFRQMLAARAFNTAAWSDESRAAYAQFVKMPHRYFPPDPTETSASLGGMAACNSSGAKTYKYGATRPYISAVRVALVDGDVVALRRGKHFADGRSFSLTTGGGRTLTGVLPSYTMPACKNASGYFTEDNMDLIDLFIGSDGTLGVMTEIELRLIAMPKVIWGVNCFFSTDAKALDFVDSVRLREEVVALEYFDKYALAILREHTDGGFPIPDGFACMIYVELHSETEESGEAALRFLGDMMEAAGADSGDTWCARSLPDRERLLELRHKVPESVNGLIARRKRDIPGIAKVGSDMAVPDARFRELFEIYHRDLEKNGFQFAVWGHIGNNHLHVNVLPRSMEEMAGGKNMFLDWARVVADMGGTVSAEHGSGKSKANMLPILYGEKGVREMAAVKRVFDPKCILGAGNLFPPAYVLE